MIREDTIIKIDLSLPPSSVADPVCLSQIPDLRVSKPDPGSRGQKSTGSRSLIRNTAS